MPRPVSAQPAVQAPSRITQRGKGKLASLFDAPPAAAAGAATFSFGGAFDGAGSSIGASTVAACSSSSSSTASASGREGAATVGSSSSISSAAADKAGSGAAISVCGLVLGLSSASAFSPLHCTTLTLPDEVVGHSMVERSIKACMQRPVSLGQLPAKSGQYEDQYVGPEEAANDDDTIAVAYAASYSVAPSQPAPLPRAALVVTCNGRGEEHHEDEEVESNALMAALPGVPFAGFFAGGECGPRFGKRNERDVEASDLSSIPENELHSFSCVVAMMGGSVY